MGNKKRSPSAKELARPRYRKRVERVKKSELLEEAIDREAEKAARREVERLEEEDAATDSADAIRFYRAGEEYGEFSNFSRHPVIIEGEEWPTTEHWYQAMKFPHDPERQERIRLEPSPMKAKRIAWERGTKPRRDWDEIRDEVMLRALRAKFS